MKISMLRSFASSLLIGLASANLCAQDYTVKMSVKVEGLPAEYAAYGEQDITTYIKGDKTKSDINSMMYSSTVLFDGKTLTSVSETMGNKTGYTATKEELEAVDKDDKGEKPKIEYTTEKKMIAGYECTKAIITNVGKDKKEIKSTVWVTDKIVLNESHMRARKASGRGMDLGDLKGYPLAMESTMNQNGMDMKMIMTATEVTSSALADDVFSINTDGYKMMSYKEMLEKMKTMGKGPGK
jgi:hypothetical protein